MRFLLLGEVPSLHRSLFMREPRFDDDEIREILARATEVRSDPETLPASAEAGDRPGEGLTLAELERVAAEVGIPAARVAQAAEALAVEQAALPTPKTKLGVEVSASHVVRLPRMLNAGEWDRFVVQLRDTFDAPGEVRTEGSLRTWSHGHLKVLLEPEVQGARLRFQSVSGTAQSLLDLGFVLGVLGLALTLLLGGGALLSGDTIPLGIWLMPIGLGALGPAMWTIGRSKALGWAPEQQAHFRTLGQQARRVAEGDVRSTGTREG